MLEHYKTEYEKTLQNLITNDTNKKITDIIEEKVYCFDFDINILFLETYVFIEENIAWKWTEIEISYEKYRNMLNDWVFDEKNFRVTEQAWRQARDLDETNYFLKHLQNALEKYKNATKNNLPLTWIIWPSFYDFKEAIINWHLLSIITARWHKEENFKAWIKLIINEIFTQKEKEIMFNNISNKYLKINKPFNSKNFLEIVDIYLNYSKLIWVNSPEFLEQINQIEDRNAHLRKPIAYNHVLDYVIDLHKNHFENDKIKVNIWFSDDELKNIDEIKKFTDEIKHLDKYKHFHFVTIDTSSKTSKNKHYHTRGK